MIIGFTIKNWEKYNPRVDRKNYAWFRFQNDFFTDPDMFSLNSEQKMVLIYVFCEASKCADGVGRLNKDMLSALCNIDSNDVQKTLQVIENTGVVEFDYPDASIRNQNEKLYPPNGCLRTDGTNERTRHDVTAVNRNQKLADLYQKYPRKEGKKRGMQIAKRDIKTDQDLDRLEKAIDSYISLLKKEKRDKQHIKHFSAFMNCWEDYLPTINTSGVPTQAEMSAKFQAERAAKIMEEAKAMQSDKRNV